MEYHKIRLISSVEGGEFSAKCSRHLTIATIMNLLDNSIWWLDHEPPKRKEIRIFTSRDLLEGPAIIVADNNTLGFIDPPELVTRPFYTRKPGGMGLGLHLADEVMKAQRGHFRILNAGDVGLPRQFKAIVALVFPEAKWLD
jgi:nitrogen fixation/metabolism regulation signal transduction histidine kinase